MNISIKTPQGDKEKLPMLTDDLYREVATETLNKYRFEF